MAPTHLYSSGPSLYHDRASPHPVRVQRVPKHAHPELLTQLRELVAQMVAERKERNRTIVGTAHLQPIPANTSVDIDVTMSGDLGDGSGYEIVPVVSGRGAGNGVAGSVTVTDFVVTLPSVVRVTLSNGAGQSHSGGLLLVIATAISSQDPRSR